MVEKTLLMFLLYSAMLIFDIPGLKKQRIRERIWYGIFLMIVSYLALSYVLELDWPNFNELFDFLFGQAVKQIVGYFIN